MPNMSWSNVTYPYAGLFGFSFGQTHRTFAENKLIEVPAGRFSGCIRVETQATRKDAHDGGRDYQLSYIEWYAPNVGLVKTLALEGGLEGLETERVELFRFRITYLPTGWVATRSCDGRRPDPGQTNADDSNSAYVREPAATPGNASKANDAASSARPAPGAGARLRFHNARRL
jgi:hypothetical protein